MGRFATLDTNTHLAWYRDRNLLPHLQVEAEREADSWVQTTFKDWDQTGWIGDGIPVPVTRAAKLVASAAYVSLDYASGRPGGAPEEVSDAAGWRAEAQDIADSILRSQPRAIPDPHTDGVWQYPAKRTGGIFVDVVRG